MPAALRMLVRTAFWGRIRRGMRGMRSPRGALISVFGCAVVVLWFLPALYFIASGEAVNPQYLRESFPMIMLMFALISLLSSGENAIYFSPAEINFLFPAPFTRRQLLVYRVATFAVASMLTAILVTIFLGRFAPLILSAYLGIALAFFFLSLLGMIVQLVGEAIALRIYTTGRRLIVLIMLAGVVALMLPVIQGGFGNGSWEAWREVRDHPFLQTLLFPLIPFGRVVAADQYFPEMIFWIAACLGECSVLFAVIVALDVNFNEASIRVSQDVYSRLQRMRSGGVFQARAASNRLSIPPFPAFGGAGVHAWRQLTHAIRMSKTVLIFMAIVILAVSAAAVVTRDADRSSGVLGWGMVGGGTLWITIFFANALRFDFRNDIEQMDLLKSLPVHTASLVFGELFAPVMVTTVLQSIVACVGAALIGPWHCAPIISLFAIP